jgi:hypothetical protein
MDVTFLAARILRTLSKGRLAASSIYSGGDV